MMMATCSLTSPINRSATPGWVCRTVQQMWMLWRDNIDVKLVNVCRTIKSVKMLLFVLYLPGWVLQCVQIPALWCECVRQTENVKNIRAYSHHWHLWIPKHKHTFYLANSVEKNKKDNFEVLGVIRRMLLEVQGLWLNSKYKSWNQSLITTILLTLPICVFSVTKLDVLLCFNFVCSTDDLLGGVNVSVLSHVHHGRPAGGDDSSWPGARYRGRGIDSPLPVWCHKVLIVTVLFITVEDHRGTFGGVAVLEKNVTHNAVSVQP